MAERTCTIEGCGNAGLLRRGWCNKHYLRWRKYGDPVYLLSNDPEGFLWRKTEVVDGCWVYRGQPNTRYPGITVGGYRMSIHRWSYSEFRGPIPDGYEVDHLCRVAHCWNPDHLEPVTQAENKRRQGAAVTACRRAGHPFTADNTYIDSRGRRSCRRCQRQRDLT